MTPKLKRWWLFAVVSLFCITGCDPKPEQELITAAGKMRYTVVTIEGRKFIAYRGAQSYLYLAGPIDK